ncbi:cutinase family protein [Spirillospora sp. CA-108201]
MDRGWIGRLRRRVGALLVVVLVASVATLPDAEAAPAGPPAASGTHRTLSPLHCYEGDIYDYWIIGVRGSGEPANSGSPEGVGTRVAPYIEKALNGMDWQQRDKTIVQALEYPATPVTNVAAWWLSVLVGISELRQQIEECAQFGKRIGLVGYSQGALVIAMTLQQMAESKALDAVKSVLLLGNPNSSTNGGNYQRYLTYITDYGGSAYRDGHGMLGNRELPWSVQDRSSELCVAGDKVCDSRSSSVLWNSLVAALNSRIHRDAYQVCCGVTDYRYRLGGSFRERLLGLGGQGRPAPPEIPAPPAGPPPVTSVHGLEDGTVLVTSDSKRVYKMVGGAPVWLTSCANGLCPDPRPTTQAVIDAGPAVPRDAATARDEAGNVFKFVGGAPIHLSSCNIAGGCGSPVPITAGSIVNYDHMRPVPADGATAKDEAGNIFKFVGGAPIHLTTCDIAGGCGTPVPITAWSVVNYDHMRPAPVDGATAKDEAGNVFRFVGGAPIHLTTCNIAGGCGNPVGISAGSIVIGDHMRSRPADGATMKDEAGNIFKFAGGAPIHLASCAVECGNPVSISAGSIVMLDHMNPVPENGTTIVTESNDAFVFAGGAPLRLSSCEIGCDTVVRISGASVANLDHMRPVPGDNATVRTETGAVYKFAGGAPLWLSNCDPGCGDPVNVTQWTVDSREHMKPAPANGTNIKAVENGTLFRTRGGEADLAGQCPAASGCSTAVVVNQASVDPIAHGVANRGPQYGLLASYANGTETRSSLGSVPAGYRLAATFGLLARTADEGTLPFYSCQTGEDVFSSTSTTCEGRTVLSRLGYIYASPPAGHPAVAVFRCKTAEGEHFDSANPTCGGMTVEGRLGYVLGYGKLTRYNAGGEHGSATMTVPVGYQAEGTLGLLPLATTPGTVPVFACRAGTDLFTATSATCEGQTEVSQLGFIYTAPPADQPSVAVYRCKTTAGDHFDSLDAACEGRTVEGRLGYVLARKMLTRATRGTDHRSGTGALPAGYRHEGTLGILAGTNEAGTVPLYSCQSGGNAFTALAADCEGRDRLGQLGWIWSRPPTGVPSLPLYRCALTDTGEHFDATDVACGGHPNQGLLGYLRVNL